MAKIIIVLIIFWMYRRIGVLRYQLNHASSEYGRTRVNYPHAPNLLAYLLYKITRGRLRQAYFSSNRCDWDKEVRKYIMLDYQEIYLWPWLRFKRHYREWRYYHAVSLAIKRIKAKKKIAVMAQ